MTRADYYRRAVVAEKQTSLRAITLLLFAGGLLGFTGPVVGLVASGYLLPQRDELRKCGPLYSFLMWVTLFVSGIFTVMIAVFLIFEWK